MHPRQVMAPRLLLIAVAALITTAGLAVRATTTGDFGQHAGTALYAALVYTCVLLIRPTLAAVAAAPLAIAICWTVELAQLTPLPAALVHHAPLTRLIFGEHFDARDLLWYAVGAAAYAALHHLTVTLLRR